MKHKYITRMDYPKTKGWWVRLYKNGAVYASEYIRDSKNGKRKGLAEAINKRDAMLKQYNHPETFTKTIPWGQFPIVGISIGMQIKSNGEDYYNWVASHDYEHKSFAVLKHGYQEGYEKSLRWLRKKQNKRYRKQTAPEPTDNGLIKWLKKRGIKYKDYYDK